MATRESIEQDITTYTDDTDWMWLLRMAYKYFATAYDMRIMNTLYQKRINHIVSYNIGGRESQIDYIMLRK